MRHLPGGVNSPVRAFRGVGGQPLFIQKAEGAYLYTTDNQKLIDYIGSWGPMICGHAFEPVIDAVTRAAARSLSFGAPTEAEVQAAEWVCKLTPGAERVRFVNSGTEACMTAIRIARAATGRQIIIKFSGCYHGHADAFLSQDAGSGLATLGLPASAGVPPSVAALTVTVPYNNPAALAETLAALPEPPAAFIVEPVAGNMGCVPPEPGYLESLRELATQHGALLIFDEVMTGFRLALGGAQERFGIRADLVTLGKIIGGGLPTAAICGPAQYMNLLAPQGPVYQAGTLSGNPLSMAACVAQLSYLAGSPAFYETLDEYSTQLAAGLRGVCQQLGVPAQVQQVGSMLSVFFTDQPVRHFADAQTADKELFARVFHHLLRLGIYLPPSAFESWFVSAAHSLNDIDTTIQGFRMALHQALDNHQP